MKNSGNVQIMEIAERRVSDRFKVSLNASITTDTGDTCDVKIENISSTGLQFLVENFQIPKLMPPQDREHKLETIPLKVDILLPDQYGPVKVSLGIAHFNRVSQHHSAIGCRFEEFFNNSSKVLAEYILNVQQGNHHNKSNVRELKSRLLKR